MKFLTQKDYLSNANKNLKEWFIDNTYDIIFIPLVARDFLTAYLMSFQHIGRIAPDLDWVLEELNTHDSDCVEKFRPLNIKLKEKVENLEYYIQLLFQCKEYMESKLC